MKRDDFTEITNEQLALIQYGSAWNKAKRRELYRQIDELQARIRELEAERNQVSNTGYEAERVLNWRTRAGRTEGDIYAEIDSLALKVSNQNKPWKLASITWSHDPAEPDTARVTIHTPFGNTMVITFDECRGIYPSVDADIGAIDADLRSFALDDGGYVFLVGDEGAEVSIHIIGEPLNISYITRKS